MNQKEIDELLSSQFKNADMFRDKPSPMKHVFNTCKGTPRETPCDCFVELTSGHEIHIFLNCNEGSIIDNSLQENVLIKDTFIPREIIRTITFR